MVPVCGKLTTTQAQRTPLFIEFPKNVYSSGRARGSTSLGVPATHSACLGEACPLEKVLGLTGEAGPYSREHQGWSRGTSLPGLTRAGEGA